jgi:endonuclease/exonuclease/phosphatase family metal-dependent hydrolase
MTYNIRTAKCKPPNTWVERRPIMRECLRSLHPDLIGTQEGMYTQIKDLASDLPDYSWIGLGREGGSRDEFMAVFYKTSRFDPLEYDHFWLSDTPNVVGSVTWGHKNKRMVTWARFLDRISGQEFYLFNTHFDHQVQTAREKAAALLLQRINGLKNPLPVIVTGDFNAEAGNNKTYDLLVNEGGLIDTWTVARERRGQALATFHNFETPRPNGPRIDWILTRGAITTEAVETHVCQQGNQHASDHLPVLAWLVVGSS